MCRLARGRSQFKFKLGESKGSLNSSKKTEQCETSANVLDYSM